MAVFQDRDPPRRNPFVLGAEGDSAFYNQPQRSRNYAMPQPWTANPLNGFLLGGYLNAPTQMANQLNSAFGEAAGNWERASAANKDRNFQLMQTNSLLNSRQQEQNANRDLVRDILGPALGGGAAGGVAGTGFAGGRLNGFKDVNSGQFASLTGQTGHGITVPPMGQQNIQDASRMALGNMGQAPMGRSASPAAGPGIQGQYAAAYNRESGRNALDMGRMAREGAADLNRQREQGVANQGIGNAQLLANLNTDNTRLRSTMNSQLIRSLLGNLTTSLQT
jgi:hypothetical protein